MRAIRWRSIMLACLALAPVALGAQAAKTEGEAAVRAVVKTYIDARERGNAAELATLFTADADQLTSSGEWRRGRDELVRGTLASSKANAGARTITIKTVRFASPDVAIADGEYVIGPTATAGARNMWTSFTIVRGEGRWQIAAIRNMLPATPAP